MHIGQQAPVLAVPQVGGGTIDLGTLRGRPVWVIFLNTSCASCVQQMSLVNGYLSRYESSGLVVIGVDVRDEEGAVSNFAKRAAATFPFGLDLDGAAQREWEAASLPAHYWIDGNGVVRDAAPGAIATERMATGLRQVLPGIDVHP
jgi:peroxiredoxin